MNTTHYKIIALLLGAGLLGLSSIASAAIVNSKHDLGSASTSGGNKVTAGTDETCVFCHTPHKAAGNSVPLWNKALPATTYTAYSSTTIDGTTTFAGSTSMACLSCHDGTQAMDNIVNAPGSGGYDATGGGTNGLGYTWSGTTVDANGLLVGTALTNLSANLGDDHPVAIQYGGGNITTGTPSATTADPDFGQVGVARAGQPTLTQAVIGGQQKWWFEAAATTNGRIDTSEIRLYTRTVGSEQPFVECASCHDPHGVGTNPTFLRVANTSSAVCTACHVK